jgi:hypothetical protein
MMNVQIKPEISTQLDIIWEHNIWNHLDVSKGTWPVMERQGSPLVGIHSSPMSGQSTDVPLNVRDYQGSDGKEGAEDGEIDDENVEAWELEDEDEDEDDDDYDDSGYYDDDADGYTAGTHLDLFSGVLRDSAAFAFDQFLELLFQLCVMLSTESFSTGNQALHCLCISAVSLDFPRIVRDFNSLDSTAQNCRR